MMSNVRQVATGETPSLPLCARCHLQPKRRTPYRLRAYCGDCEREIQREQHAQDKSVTKRCEQCGEKLPHPKGYCPVGLRLRLIKRGRRLLNEHWPGYGDALTDERWLEKIGHSFPRSAYPPPSFVFGLSTALDQRLIIARKDKDVTFCRTLAQVPTSEQR